MYSIIIEIEKPIGLAEAEQLARWLEAQAYAIVCGLPESDEMTRDQLLALGKDPPILLRDGSFGLLIRLWPDGGGVQVPGDEDIRIIPYEQIADIGDGALVQADAGAAALAVVQAEIRADFATRLTSGVQRAGDMPVSRGTSDDPAH